MSHGPDSVFHSPGSAWSQEDLGEEFDVARLSVIGELDPTGRDGVLKEVLDLLMSSLDPLLVRLEKHRAAGHPAGIRFEAHKLHSAAAQLGAMRLSRAAKAVSTYFDAGGSTRPGQIDPHLGMLIDTVTVETIRVQRRLSRLLGS